MPPAIAPHTVTENPAIVSTITRVCSVIFLEKLLSSFPILLSSCPIFIDSPAISLKRLPSLWTAP